MGYIYVCFTEHLMLPSEFEETRLQMEAQTKADMEELLETYRNYYGPY